MSYFQALITKLLLLDGDLMKPLKLNIGSEETHGVLIGEKTDSSEFKCTRITLVLKANAIGEFQK